MTHADNDDFAFEAAPGLPQPLPTGEHLIWQGGPQWLPLARRAFLGDWIAIYFAALIIGRMVVLRGMGRTAEDAFVAGAWLIVPALATLAIIALLARASARTTVYTITSRRIVMRFGIALPITINFPFKALTAADLRVRGDGVGDIALSLNPAHNVAYLILWPHLQPLAFARTKPTFRCIGDAKRVAGLLGAAVGAASAAAKLVPGERIERVVPVIAPIEAVDAGGMPSGLRLRLTAAE